jgi:hypothetical protein
MSGVDIDRSHATLYGLQKLLDDGAHGPSVVGSCWARGGGSVGGWNNANVEANIRQMLWRSDGSARICEAMVL